MPPITYQERINVKGALEHCKKLLENFKAEMEKKYSRYLISDEINQEINIIRKQ